MAETPYLDELTNGPWPSFVTEMKKVADRKPMVAGLLEQLEASYQDGISYWEQSKLVEKFILFRPVILKHQQDEKRFARRQFFDRDIDIAKVMRDALLHLKLHYAVDHDRFFMTGLSQAGYYSYYYAISFPDMFAGIVPESAGGMALRASVWRLSANLKSVRVRILHAKGDVLGFGRFRFDAKEIFSASVGAASSSTMVFEFPVPSGATPRHLMVKNVRVPMDSIPKIKPSDGAATFTTAVEDFAA